MHCVRWKTGPAVSELYSSYLSPRSESGVCLCVCVSVCLSVTSSLAGAGFETGQGVGGVLPAQSDPVRLLLELALLV